MDLAPCGDDGDRVEVDAAQVVVVEHTEVVVLAFEDRPELLAGLFDRSVELGARRTLRDEHRFEAGSFTVNAYLSAPCGRNSPV